jgi:hypothetical protein
MSMATTTTQSQPKRVRRFIVRPDGITTSVIVNGETILSHEIVATPGRGGWAMMMHEFNLRVGKHIAEHPNGRLIELIDMRTNTRMAALCKRISFRIWQIDIPED